MTGATNLIKDRALSAGGKLNYFVLSNGHVKLSPNYLFTPMD